MLADLEEMNVKHRVIYAQIRAFIWSVYSCLLTVYGRSDRLQMICKIRVPNNFAEFTGKHLYRSLFLINAAVLQPATVLKKTVAQAFFSCGFCQILKSTFFV